MTRSRAWALVAPLLVLLAGCADDHARYQHAAEHPSGHDHHEAGHGHGETAVTRITRWSGRYELFAEHQPIVAGSPSELLAYLTVLEDFRPLAAGALVLELDGPATIRATAPAPLRPGIFAIAFTAPVPGLYEGRVVVAETADGAIEGVALRVWDSAEAAEEGESSAEEDPGLIELLKEQQWTLPFATAVARPGTLAASLEVAGTIETPPGGSAEVGPPVTGRLLAPANGFPRPGDAVSAGEVLARLVPAPSAPEEAARARLVVAEAEARAAAARLALERAERLFRDEAIARRELEDARRETEVARAAVRAARAAAALLGGTPDAAAGEGAWTLTAPIDGTVEAVAATPGATVAPGAVLFRIVDTRELWIRARVPEQDAARLRPDRDARFRHAGAEEWRTLDLTGADAGATLVRVGRTVDPTARTVDVVYALAAPHPDLRVGGLVQVDLPVGDPVEGLVIPRGAVVDDEGRSVVYVQIDGEHFRERPVALGPRTADRVAVLAGLAAGERIVVRGAQLVRLAAEADTREPHGHIH